MEKKKQEFVLQVLKQVVNLSCLNGKEQGFKNVTWHKNDDHIKILDEEKEVRCLIYCGRAREVCKRRVADFVLKDCYLQPKN